MAYLDGAINAHRDQDVRGALAQLAATAERTGAAILVLRHLNKSTGGPAVYRGGGSIGIIGAARSALVVGRDPDDENRMVLAVTKANLAPIAPSLTYRMVDRDGVGAVEWGGVTARSAGELLAARSDPSADERSALDDAKAVLAEVLSNGPVGAREVWAEARSAGIADRTLDRAKAGLGVVARKVGRPGETGQRWEWSLPEGRQEAPNTATPGGGRTSTPLGALRVAPDPIRPDLAGRPDDYPSAEPIRNPRRAHGADGLFPSVPWRDGGVPIGEPVGPTSDDWGTIG